MYVTSMTKWPTISWVLHFLSVTSPHTLRVLGQVLPHAHVVLVEEVSEMADIGADLDVRRVVAGVEAPAVLHYTVQGVEDTSLTNIHTLQHTTTYKSIASGFIYSITLMKYFIFFEQSLRKIFHNYSSDKFFYLKTDFN